MRILIVEDDFGSRRMMQKLLEPYGDVDVVVDGEEALRAFELAWEDDHPYSLIFLDIMMPNMDGHEALKRMRARERELGVKLSGEAKIVMTSILEDPHNVIEAYHGGGATSYLVKPIDRARLQLELERIGISPRS